MIKNTALISNISMQALPALLRDIHLIRVPHPSVKYNREIRDGAEWFFVCQGIQFDNNNNKLPIYLGNAVIS